MVPGGAIAYDCLEFSQALRVRDTSEELAFLAMDLEARGRADVAERVMRVYLDEARRDPATAEREVDFEAPQRWFRLSDALVRAMVDSLRAGRGEGTANTAAHRDVDLACGHALEPLFVLMCGLPGSGKSTVARALARPLRADVIRSDEVRKELAGIAPTERGDAAIYAAEMTERVYDELVARARRALDAGRHVIIDAAFPSRALRARAIERLADGERQAGRGPVGGWILVECTARKPELQRRLEARSREPREVSDADESVMRLMATRFEPPDELAAAHRIQVDSADAAVPHRVVERLATTATTE